MGGNGPIATASLTLLYPLYTCDFDPNDPTKLIVGGGGGPTRSGVGNKIVGSLTCGCLPHLLRLHSHPRSVLSSY